MALSITATAHCVDFEQAFISHCPATKNLGKHLLEFTGYLCLRHIGWLTSRVITARLQHRCGGTQPCCYHLFHTRRLILQLLRHLHHHFQLHFPGMGGCTGSVHTCRFSRQFISEIPSSMRYLSASQPLYQQAVMLIPASFF